jgi:hypothetical protein
MVWTEGSAREDSVVGSHWVLASALAVFWIAIFAFSSGVTQGSGALILVGVVAMCASVGLGPISVERLMVAQVHATLLRSGAEPPALTTLWRLSRYSKAGQEHELLGIIRSEITGLGSIPDVPAPSVLARSQLLHKRMMWAIGGIFAVAVVTAAALGGLDMIDTPVMRGGVFAAIMGIGFLGLILLTRSRVRRIQLLPEHPEQADRRPEA